MIYHFQASDDYQRYLTLINQFKSPFQARKFGLESLLHFPVRGWFAQAKRRPNKSIKCSDLIGTSHSASGWTALVSLCLVIIDC